MNSLQSVFDELHLEAKAVLDEAGYESRSVVLRAIFDPYDGWGFEVLATHHTHPSLRRSLARASTADELLRVLREKVTVPQL